MKFIKLNRTLINQNPMKRTTVFLIISLLVIVGCGENKQTTEGLITLDVTASYPKKELILQDFFDVEYVPLETTEEFLTMAWVHTIGKKTIIVRNRFRATDGKIFIYDRNGKAVKIINRLGHGDEEYVFLLGVTLDEENDEIFVNDHWVRKVFVYDLSGNFKRNFKHAEDRLYDMGLYNFDKDNLICSSSSFAFEKDRSRKPNTFLVISKKDGSITKEIEIPYKEKISSMVFSNDSAMVMPIRNRTLVPSSDKSWMLMEDSSDKIYQLKSDYSLEPIITRTPPVLSMNPRTFLYPAVYTDRYCFMQTVEGVWNWVSNRGHHRVNLMHDKQENATFEYVMYNADIEDKTPVSVVSEMTYGDSEIAFVQKLETSDLLDAYEKGKLKGRLKEIAATLGEDANPVIMLAKYKK